jgi:hypothetical protein
MSSSAVASPFSMLLRNRRNAGPDFKQLSVGTSQASECFNLTISSQQRNSREVARVVGKTRTCGSKKIN